MMKQNNNKQRIEVWEKPLHLIGSFENPLTLEDIETALHNLNMPKSNLRNTKLVYENLLDGTVIYKSERNEK